MTEQAVRRRRHPEVVVGRAVLVGLVSAVPLALLVLLLPLFARALAGGAGLAQAWAATVPTDDEDLEMLPLYLVGALVVGALVALVAAGVWCVVASRVPDRAWVARASATVAAAAVPVLLFAWENWSLAAPTALAAGLIALVAAPHVGYDRPRGGPVAVE